MTRNYASAFLLLLCAVDIHGANESDIDVYSALAPNRTATIFLRLYTGTTIEQYVDAPLVNASNLVAATEDARPTVLYIHGFTESVQSSSVHTVIFAYLTRQDHNVFALDWSKIAGQSYEKVAGSAEEVGSAVATALESMGSFGLPIDGLHIVGNSMGAQVAGFVGRTVEFVVPRITGLDPAGPLFHYFLSGLSADDARFVDVIHTDYGFYGIGKVIGDVDFFPNDGRRVQPGCPKYFLVYSTEEFCSHHRSWKYYAESLTTVDAFEGVRCNSPVRFSLGKCDGNERVVMGYGTSKNA